MEVTELRIGNNVLHNGKIKTINAIEKFAVNFEKEDPELTLNYSDEIEPILISEEWLLKFGFMRLPWGLVKGSLLFKDQNHECKVLTLEVGNGFRTTVTYIHQLQNLYFTLAGEELCTQ
ncbi:hypothetical protein [Chryseobacterium sp. FH1]|uniref:hypothetical protein n=1 Tax=Chryseobacterium sp. FH1 TaxID=1233951 RepID=UPI0004E399EB|nr:hypothetical protein [Chryseobacterium sp. FH1]KFC19371.1 hypothetical protein IO90_08695 [Chryseobacterium sp. FH1]